MIRSDTSFFLEERAVLVQLAASPARAMEDDQSRVDQSLANPQQSAAATEPDDPAAEFYGLDYSGDGGGTGDGAGERASEAARLEPWRVAVRRTRPQHVAQTYGASSVGMSSDISRCNRVAIKY